ncbi:MAG: nucleoside triphosphate pyrophosphohydrolase [bacterium]
MTKKNSQAAPIQKLLDLMKQLRGPEGCPWDREQTPESLRPYIIEEAYELVDAIEVGDSSDIQEELGDLLLQVVFQCQLASEAGHFSFDDAVKRINEKLIRRHPHVFGSEEAMTGDEATEHWERIKYETEGKTRTDRPTGLPILHRTLRLQEKAVSFGFDWEKPEDLLDKVAEELGEIRSALDSGDREELVDEVGDLFFMTVNLARFLNIYPDDAIERSLIKFRKRFRSMKRQAERENRSLEEMNIDEMEELWKVAKREEKAMKG